MKQRSNLRVGISIQANLVDPNLSLWSNGITQNIVFLGMLLQKLPCVSEVNLVSISPEGVEQCEPHSISTLFGIPTISLEDAVHHLDVIIELGMRVPKEAATQYRRTGGKLVSYVAGNVMVMNMEGVAKRLNYGEILNHAGFDAVWITPQHWKTNESYMFFTRSECIYRVPHIWDSIAVRHAQMRLQKPFSWKPVAKGEGWKIANFEPNVNAIKTFHMPLLVCENAYRLNAELIKHVFLMNTHHLIGQTHLEEFVAATNLGRDKRVTCEPRMPIVDILSCHADAVVAHQWENNLNYHYWDTLYGSFPLIHNSDALKGVGYYYPEFDPIAGGKSLLNAILNHEENLASYKKNVAEFLWHLSIENPGIQQVHHELLQVLFTNDEKIPPNHL